MLYIPYVCNDKWTKKFLWLPARMTNGELCWLRFAYRKASGVYMHDLFDSDMYDYVKNKEELFLELL